MTHDLVDAHMHLWQLSENDWYPALKDLAEQAGLESMYRDWLPEDYRAAAGDWEVTGLVHVSAVTKPRAYLEETTWVSDLADQQGLDLVVVGTIDPGLDEAGIIADLEQQAALDRFRGVRVLYDFEPNSPAAHTVLGWLQRENLVFDLVTPPAGMTAWLETLASYPDLSVVLEHAGWPAATDRAGQDEWLAAITACATQTDALCKISGLGMATMDLSAPTLRPWVEQAIEQFGWDRVAFGSNIPIEHLAGAYGDLRASLTEILGEASAEEQGKFYGANATRTYRF